MNTLLASEAKVNRALVAASRRRLLTEAQEGDRQEVSDLVMRVAGRVGFEGWFVMQHGGRSGGERCSCYEPLALRVT